MLGGSNPIMEIIQVYFASIRNRKFEVPNNSEELHVFTNDKESALEYEFIPHSNTYRILDKATIQLSSESEFNLQSQWIQCRVTKVEKAKTMSGTLPFFKSSIIASTCLAQLQSLSIHQGTTMDSEIFDLIKIPAASLPLIPTIFMIIIVHVYDRIIVPLTRRITGCPKGIPHLQRVGIDLILSGISMLTAALVAVKRKQVTKTHDMVDADPEYHSLLISTFWLSFQYFIFGMADFLTYVGLLEFFYSEAPNLFKSTATTFHCFVP